MRLLTSTLVAAFMIIVVGPAVHADVPTEMNVQGRLTDSTGAPIASATPQFEFSIWNDASTGTQVWPPSGTELQTIATDAGGLWTARVGSNIGTGARPSSDATILIEGDRIVEIGRRDQVQVPPGTPIIDASRMTVLPGLIDAHVHILGSGEPNDDAFFTAAAERAIPELTLTSYRNAMRSLEAGWTTLRDAACRHYLDVAIRDAIDAGSLPGPRLWTCGLGITSTAGHMDFAKFLAPHMPWSGPSAVADGPTEGRRAVRQNLAQDVDFIKINATLTEHVRRYQGYCAPEMTRETMAAIIEEAHWHGRKVTAHCYGGDGATWAIEAGIDGIEHGFYLTDTHLEMMADRGTVLCPTLSVPGRFREMGDDISMGNGRHLAAWRKKAVASAWDTVRRAKEAGVTIICGDDAAMPYIRHGGNAYELEMLVEAGLTPLEAIGSATGVAARALAIPDVGELRSGAFADLVVVDGDPLADVRILQDLDRIAIVIKGGETVIDRRATA